MARLIPLLLTMLAATGCGQAPQPIEIPFVPTFGGLPIQCRGEGPQLTDLRLYVAGLSLVSADGTAVPVTLEPDGTWQRAELAMLDFEDGTGGCDNGSRALNSSLFGTVPEGEYRGLRFVVGVPFDLNHGDPLQAQPPLGDAAMHWHWRGGYKFLRAGVRHGTRNFWIHLGSTGCKGKLQDITGCNAPNRVVVEIDGFDWQRDAVSIDLAELMRGTLIAEQATVSCSSSPAEESCAAPFRALGLGAQAQSVFGKQPQS